MSDELEKANSLLLAKRRRVAAALGDGSLTIDFDKKTLGAGMARAAPVKLPDIDRLPVVENEPEACECRGRGWLMDPDTRLARPCPCRRWTYENPEDVPVSELHARGVDAKVAGRLREHWNAKHEPWPLEADHWPQDMEIERGLGEDDERPSWLYLWGPSGSGKSAVAAWIMRRFIARGTPCRWIPLRKTIKQTYERIASRSPAPVWSWLKYPFVVLEEFGDHREDLSSHDDVLGQIVEARQTLKGGFQVVTSNWHPVKLRRAYSRMGSRMLSGHVKEMKGPDARRRRWHFALADAIEEARR